MQNTTNGLRPFNTYSCCTTGFAIWYLSGGLWYPGMTLSNHCGTNRDWHTPNSELFVGNTGAGNNGLDANYLTGSDDSTTVYIGANNSSSGLAINGGVYPSVGTAVCYSGGYSGAVCYNTIEDRLLPTPAASALASGRPMTTDSRLRGTGTVVGRSSPRPPAADSTASEPMSRVPATMESFCPSSARR